MQNSFLEIQNVTKSFYQGDQEIPVLKGVNLCVGKGCSAAILGRSGSGKSTLLSLICGLDRPDSGDLVFEGMRYSSLGEAELTLFRGQRMGVIFQQFHLLPHLSALENVVLAAEILKLPEPEAAGLDAIRRVGLEARQNHLPLKLSGGEKQRVAIARAMVISPSLLLADEPSGSLDEDTGKNVMDLIFELVSQEQTGLILVTHNRELAGRCDQRFQLDHGVLRETEL